MSQVMDYLIIYHIGVYETRDLFLRTSSWIYNKEKREQLKVVIFE